MTTPLPVRDALTRPIPITPDPHAPVDVGDIGRMAWTYANHGRKVIICWGIRDDLTCACGKPCPKPGKHPLGAQWACPKGKDSATTNPDVVAGWYRRALDDGIAANVAIVPVKGESALDADQPDRPDVLAARQTLYAAGAPMQETGREGGWHAFLRVGRNGPVKGSGVEFKGDGDGYVVVAPSLSATGRVYRWLQGGRPIDPPAGLIEGLTATQRVNGAAEAVLIHIVDDWTVAEGERYPTYRNEALALYAEGWLGRPREVKAALRGLLGPRFSPPYTEDQWRHAETEVVDRDHQPEHLADTRRLVSDWRARSPGTEPPARPAVETIALLDAVSILPARDEPPADIDDWFIAGPDGDEGILRPGYWTVWASPVGMGKSYMRLEMAARLALGTGAFLGVFPVQRPVRVLTIDEDNGARLEWKRLLQVCAALGVSKAALGENFILLPPTGANLRTESGRSFIEAAVRHHRAEVLILDTGSLMVGEEWGPELNAAVHFLKALAEREGISVFTTVHVVKAMRNQRTGDRFTNRLTLDDVMGHWARAAHVVGLMSPDNREKSSGWLDIEKRGHVGSYLIERRPGLWVARTAPLVHTETPTGATTDGAERDDLTALQALFDGFSMRSALPSGGDADRVAKRLDGAGFIAKVNGRWMLTETGRLRVVRTGTGPGQEPGQEGFFERE